jgi:hypothetical protein
MERKQKVSQLRPRRVISLSLYGGKNPLNNANKFAGSLRSPAAAAIERCPFGEQIVLLALNS